MPKAFDEQKKFTGTSLLAPSFYVLPYADSNPGQGDDYNLTQAPPSDLVCDINLAFFTPSENQETQTYGNRLSDIYISHLCDQESIKQFSAKMRAAGRRVFVSYIDTPNIHWKSVNVTNFVRNTEGQIADDGSLITNKLMEDYVPVGRMWDAETEDSQANYQALGTIMKACFLQGITRDPDNYVFIYTTYANRDIDAAILLMLINENGDWVDKALYERGYRQISDFITMRGGLSILETMSYGNPPEERFEEADIYAGYLGKGDPTKLNEMRKFISIGVAPGLTSTADACTIAAACDSTTEAGYGRFMVWGANCPDGVALFKSMVQARTQGLPKELLEMTGKPMPSTKVKINKTSGNRHSFLKAVAPPRKDIVKGSVNLLVTLLQWWRTW